MRVSLPETLYRQSTPESFVPILRLFRRTKAIQLKACTCEIRLRTRVQNSITPDTTHVHDRMDISGWWWRRVMLAYVY